MLGFWQTIKIALRLPYAKISASFMILGPVSAFLIPVVIPDQSVSNFLLLVVVFLSSVAIERFCAYVRAVRTEDLRRNGKGPSGETPAKKRKKKR